MNHTGHMVVGGIVGIIAMLILHVFSLPLTAICLLGALLPDIDLKKSKASQIVQPIAALGVAFLLYPFISTKLSTIAAVVVSLVVGAVAVFILLFPLRLKHRGVTHSWKAAAVFAVIGFFASGVSGAVIAFLSYASHLVVDKV